MMYNNRLEALKYVFTRHEKLKEEIEKGELVNLDEQIIYAAALRDKARKWSLDERFLLYLALNLYCDISDIKIDLSRIERLDASKRDIALAAIRIRFDLI